MLYPTTAPPPPNNITWSSEGCELTGGIPYHTLAQPAPQHNAGPQSASHV